MKKLFHSLRPFATVAFFLLYAPHTSAQVSPTCDTDYYDILSAKGYLEGAREMEAAQRLILKPDSVLEYSCFHEDILMLGNWGATFSENAMTSAVTPPEFDGGINIFGGNLDNALASVIYQSLVEFLDSFSHLYGGGTYSTFPVMVSCNPMNVVWHVAKCENMDPSTWVEFANLASTDIRTTPWPCTNGGSRSPWITTALSAAFPPPASPMANGGMDLLQYYRTYLTGSCASSQPIPTGIIAKYSGGTNVPDHVCVIPKCSFNGSNACQ